MTTTRRTPSQNNRTRNPQNNVAAPVTVSLNPPPPADEPKAQMERVGDMLKRVREERGDDLQQIADYLCIRRSFLVALENNRYEEFTADAYVIGFLRSYAEYLGVNSKDVIDRYRNEMSGRRKKPVLSIPTPITEGRTPSALIMTGAAVAALLVYALWYGLSSSDRTTVTTPPALPSTSAPSDTSSDTTNNPQPIPSVVVPPPEAPPMPASTSSLPPATPLAPAPSPSLSVAPPPEPAPVTPVTSGPSPTSSSQVAADAASKDSRLSIRSEQSTWVLVADSKGHALYDHVMKPGEVYKVPKGSGLTLTTGNGSGIVLTLEGVDLPKLSSGSTHVMRNIPLDDAHLKALPPNPDD